MSAPNRRKSVATVIEARMRSQLDAVADGRFNAFHAASVDELMTTVRERSVQAVFVSPHCIAPQELPRVARLIEGFPGVNTVALVSDHDPTASERLLNLGMYGVREMVDVSRRRGWYRLRELMDEPSSPTGARILASVVPALADATADCRQFFEVSIRGAPSMRTVPALTAVLRVHPSTLTSRFFRARLPSPKRYLIAARLVYAAGILEIPGLSIADAAYRLEYSSPQSFGRHLRVLLGITASEFRRRYSFEVALQDYIERLVVPFRSTFRTFHPLDYRGGTPRASVSNRTRSRSRSIA